MYSVHMGYHGFQDPFKCRECGEEAEDALTFFLHIARREHQ
jgi:hunchback-like protein